MDKINLTDVQFQLLLTLCAHDFRHDFMSSSTRVHTGYIVGFEQLGGGKYNSHKRKDETMLPVYLNDIIFLENLKNKM